MNPHGELIQQEQIFNDVLLDCNIFSIRNEISVLMRTYNLIAVHKEQNEKGLALLTPLRPAFPGYFCDANG
jgi:hypothetical protein